MQYQKLIIILSSLQYHHDAISFTLKKSVCIYLLNVNNENNKTWSIIY